MYTKRKILGAGCSLLLHTCIQTTSSAQLSVSGQLRTRSEWRDGQGAPLPKEAQPAFFTSQRTRLQLSYTTHRLKLNITGQDVRVWGQDVSTINRTTTPENNGLMLHEAWAQIQLSDTANKEQILSLKLGRQELVYDDQRLLGNLDWLQQGRRHDAALAKWESSNWRIHLGAAFNQNRENSSGTLYNSNPPGNYPATTNGSSMYKSMQFLYASKTGKKGPVSLLFFTDQFSRYSNDTVNNTAVKSFTSGSWSRITTGLYTTQTFGKLSATASAYYQFGKTAAGQKLDATLVSFSAQYLFTKRLSAGPGADFTSGGTNGTTQKTFDPLYGTPHKFWGFMDYFYVASPFGKGGLQDYYLKTKLKASDRLTLTADLHQFNSAAFSNVANNSKSLGQELDITGTYNLTKQVSIEGGYAHFFPTALLTAPAVKNIPNAREHASWAYLMVNIKPDFLSR